ncbi:UDP-N-acetylmuramoyl-L-alanyl-D-glutamate--2,6-diaminopimelate ligase, partial [Enterococcus faecium]|nr:UDP-N-acetylmuramoyl-L-alanyl-D-glutamate--2,6-diaminopimelate ligase [Enterococcus faecium]
ADVENGGVDFLIQDEEDDLTSNRFTLVESSSKAEAFHVAGDYDLNVAGDYNQSNATAAIIAAALADVTYQDAVLPLKSIVIPGRMEHLDVPGHGVVFVDYAHNYASLHALLKFLKHQYH